MDFELLIKSVNLIKLINLALTVKLLIWSISKATSIASHCNKYFSLKRRETLKTRYIHCLCSSKTHMFLKLLEIHIVFM